MASVFDYIFNIGGNFTNQISGMTDATGRFSGQVEGARDRITGLASVLGSFDYFRNIVQNVADGFSQLSGAGIQLDAQMHDLSAVAGVTGEGLKQIETFARQSAKAFGTDAAVAVEGYKLLLSQLSPELGKYPEALSAMGDCIQTTSKLDTIYNINEHLKEINHYHYENHNINEITYTSSIFTGNKNYYSRTINFINRYFDTNQYYKTINNYYKRFRDNITNSEYKTLNEFYVKRGISDFSKTINEIIENNYNIIKDNTYFYSFSIDGNPNVKLGDHVSNFAENVIENINYRTENCAEELNSLEFPSYSTNLILNTPNYYNSTNQYEYFEDKRKIFNISKTTRDFSIGCVQPRMENQENNYKKSEKISEREKVIFQKEEPKEILRPGISREDIESVVIEMFRREVELCSY